MGLLAAISIVLVLLLRIPLFPSHPYLEYDMADVPVLLGAYLLGPGPGMIILCVVSVIQAFFLGGNGIIGMTMHICASGVLLLTAALVYRALGKSTKAMIISLIAGTLAMALVMIPLNLIFTVHFLGTPREAVIALLPTVIVPFNLIKAGLNCFLFFLLCKSIGFLFEKRKQTAAIEQD